MAPKKSGGKKKVVSNRGFSTVSVPRKKDVEEEQVVVEAPAVEEVAQEQAPQAQGVEDEWDPEASERHEFQALADKIRLGSDKEVARVSKVVDYERRLAKGFPSYPWVEQDLQRRIIAVGLAAIDEGTPLPLYESEDKVIAKVATLFGTLGQLGFTRERIEECLRAVKTLDYEEALDWLFLHCEAEELHCQGPIVAALPLAESVPPTPTQPDHPSSSSTPATPATPATSSLTSLASSIADVEASLRARILAYAEEDPEAESEALVEETANQVYAGLKLQLSEIQRAQGVAKRLKAKSKGAPLPETKQDELMEMQCLLLKKKIKTVEGDYTFRKPDAELLYRAERTKLDASQLSRRLNATDLEAPLPIVDAEPVPLPAARVESSPSETTTPPSIDTDDDSPGDLFGNLLDEMPREELNDTGTTIPVRDMALPKHFSGKTPKVNLEETVRKVDKYATISFKVISRSRAVRASVSIRWDGGRNQTFEMQETACWDQPQAYNYIATVALFKISHTAVNKQLPLLFRDLWDELVVKQKEEDDEAYRHQLKLFRAIAEPRLQPPPSRDSKVAKIQEAPAGVHATPSSATEVSVQESEKLMQELYVRQQWPSYQEMLRTRASLPIAAYRSFIMSTIESSQCVVLCGETGCGKSTQVPSFILEHDLRLGKPVKVFCTEPRRISAISLAQRVSAELGEAPGVCGTRSSLVGYSIRLDSHVSPANKIVYATTGIVLRMLEGRESLADCTHIIIDEVHERSIDSDFLLIVLRTLLQTRKDLKVILMSATVDAEKMAAYMGNCPVINVPGRTFPVTAHFLEDVVELTRYRLEPSSDSPYVARGMRTMGGRSRKADIDDSPPDEDDEPDVLSGAKLQTTYSKQTRTTIDCLDHHAINYDLIVLLLENLCFYQPDLVGLSSAILIFLPSLESIRRLSDVLEGHQAFGSNQFLILPLHSTISNENQSLVFNVPRAGVRKIVISTNLAETGITIPDITAVIDTGKHREMRFDEKRQISRLVETFVAQSNASQRRGRAGRVQEGICFHLFTKQRHDTVMAEHPQPEMLRLSLQDLALRIKVMKIGSSIEGVLLQALDPPLAVNVQRAIASLIEVKALTTLEEITPLGRHLAKLPMDVHLGKFLIMSCLFGCLDAALTITAALTSKSPWLTPFGRENEADAVKRSFKVENSDFLTLYNAYCHWREASGNGYEREFTRKSFLSQQNLVMIEELRQQSFTFLVDVGFVQAPEGDKRELTPARYGKSRTRFVRVPPELDTHSRDPKAVMACLAASMYPKLLVIDPANKQLRTLANSAPASIHPSSVNFTPGKRIDFGDAKFVAFFTAMHTKKLYIWESGTVDERAVYLLCGHADFQLPAHSLSIDRKIRVQLEPKTAIAMKVLRIGFNNAFAAKMRNPSVTTDSQQQWFSLVKEALCSKNVVEVIKRVEGPKVQITLQRNA